MKKLICLTLVAITLVTLTACTSHTTTTTTNPEVNTSSPQTRVKQVEKQIEKLATVDASNEAEAKLKAAENAYNMLSDAEKKQVTNYGYLQENRLLFNYYDLKETATNRVIKSLKAKLKNPDSLQIHSSKVIMLYTLDYKTPLAIEVELDYSAQNGFGGYNRDEVTEYYKVNTSVSYSSISSISYSTYSGMIENSQMVLGHWQLSMHFND